MSLAVDDYLASIGVEVGDELKHYGKKGMKWGVRNERPSGGEATSKVKLTPEQLAHRAEVRKKVVVGAGIVAGILATSAVAYAVHDRHQLNQIKDVMRVGEMNLENLKKSPLGDKMIQQGAEFTRRSFLSNAAWPTDVRTYVVEGGDTGMISRYGDKVYNFVTNRDVKIAGLNSQIGILRSNEGSIVAKAMAKEHAKLSISGRRYIDKLSRDDFAKFALESLRRSAWDGGESGQAAGVYAKLLKSNGYSGVNDLNLPETMARILFDKTAVSLK